MNRPEDADARRVRGMVDGLVARSPDGAWRLVRHAGWIAAPIESGDHLTQPTMLRIIDALAAEPSARLWAVMLESAGDMPGVLPIDATEADLALLNRRLGFLNVALVAISPAAGAPLWLLACSTDDFAIALGPPERVAALVGGTAEAAARAFAVAAAEAHWPAGTRVLLGEVARAAAGYGTAEPGSDVQVPASVPA